MIAEQVQTYWQAAGLYHDPFSNAINSNFLIKDWQSQSELVEHLVKFSQVLILLLADEGVGKTTFIDHLLQRFDDVKAYQMIGDPNLDASKLLQTINEAFKLNEPLDITTNTDKQAILSDYVTEINQRKQRCLFIIDDAHLIPQGILQLLLHAIRQQSGEAYFNIVLLGEHMLDSWVKQVIDSEQAQYLHTIELACLNLDEAKEYISCRLQAAGFTGDFPIPINVLTKIYKKAHGRTSMLNQYLGEYLAEQYSGDKNVLVYKWRDHLKWGAMVAGLSIISLGAFIFLHQKKTQLISQPVITPLLAVKAPLVPPEPMQQTVPTGDVVKVQPKSEIKKAIIPSNQIVIRSSAVEVAHQTSALPSRIPHYVIRAQHRAVNKDIPLNNLGRGPSLLETKRALVAARKGYAIIPSPVVVDKVIVIPELEHATVNPAAIIKPASKVVPMPIVESIVANQYTLQILGTTKLAVLKKFIVDHHITSNAHYYKTVRQGKNWYVLVYGGYKDHNQAKSAIASLPTDLRKYKPWPRKLASLE